MTEDDERAEVLRLLKAGTVADGCVALIYNDPTGEVTGIAGTLYYISLPGLHEAELGEDGSLKLIAPDGRSVTLIRGEWSDVVELMPSTGICTSLAEAPEPPAA
jgi:hypothetical protein